jgi:hypothetical protein
MSGGLLKNEWEVKVQRSNGSVEKVAVVAGWAHDRAEEMIRDYVKICLHAEVVSDGIQLVKRLGKPVKA